MAAVKSKPGLRKHYNGTQKEVHQYFQHLLTLLDGFLRKATS